MKPIEESFLNSIKRDICSSCNTPIIERFGIILKDKTNSEIDDLKFHDICFRCSCCNQSLVNEINKFCYLIKGKSSVQCFNCRMKEKSCSKCHQLIYPDSWIYKLDKILYHLSCFTCCQCHRQICQGEKCYAKQDILYCSSHIPGKLAFQDEDELHRDEDCPIKSPIKTTDGLLGSYFGLINLELKNDFNDSKLIKESEQEHIEIPLNTDIPLEENDSDKKSLISDYHLSPDDLYSHRKNGNQAESKSEDSNSVSKGQNNNSKLKRIRTSFTPDQLVLLQASFEMEANPDGQELERIANSAKLNKRVTQVWFQNARARKKKTQKNPDCSFEDLCESGMSLTKSGDNYHGIKLSSVNSSDSSDFSFYQNQNFESNSPRFLHWLNENENVDKRK